MKTPWNSRLCRALFSILLAGVMASAETAIADEQPILLAQAFARPFIMAPIVNSFRAIETQRHQSRTQLYREALEELRKNPAAADVGECPAGEPAPDAVCIRAAKQEDTPVPPLAPPSEAAPVAVPDQAPQPDTLAAVEIAPPASAPPAEAEKPLSPPPVKLRKFAVLFGNNGYLAPIPALETPIADVEVIGRILQERFGYEVRIVRNAKKADLVSALNQIGLEAGAGDSVLVVYAGHGYLMDDTKMGYWIPVDGSVKSPANWVSNTDIAKFLKNIQAKQVILVSDSCFSGSLTREEKVRAASIDVDRGRILERRSVLVMSSGGEEPVSDEGKDGHSIFAWSLISALKSTQALTPGVKIFQLVKNEVVKDYPQEPQYGAVLSAGHMEGGEYLFETHAQ